VNVTAYRRLGGLILVFSAIVVLFPGLRMAQDWYALSRLLPDVPQRASVAGFDWVHWEDDDGAIVASYVFPRGPAAHAGIRSGDVFYELEHQQYFTATDLKRAVDGVSPGLSRTYFLVRDGEFHGATVRFTQYPTFLYPLSGALWYASLWGFIIGSFLHILGLAIVGPLALRSRKALLAFVLIGFSALWMFSNALRILMIEFGGPPEPLGGASLFLFKALTAVGLVGWIVFPALLLRSVVGQTRLFESRPVRLILPLVYIPPVVLGFAALQALLTGSFGPIGIDALIALLLFYACTYVAAAAALVVAVRVMRLKGGEALTGGWSRIGSVVILAFSAMGALAVFGALPFFGAVTDVTAGWLILAAQLFYIAPVALVTDATLRHGKVDVVLNRFITSASFLGLLFLAFVGGMTLLDPYLSHNGASHHVVTGIYLLILLILFEWGARRLRVPVSRLLMTERLRARQKLAGFQERMRDIIDVESLARETIEAVGRALRARSAILFLQPDGTQDRWITATYHPESPYLTTRVFSLIWPHVSEDGRIWSRNPELNESAMPIHLSRMLEEKGASLAVPIRGDGAPIGLLVMGFKRNRRAVYNLEDVDRLRSLSGQLAIAVERLHLVEREKELVRKSAEAQLVALRAQINPHFLFNALNTIISMISERPKEAELIVEHLAVIFRHILTIGGQNYVTLSDEVRLVSRYLAIEQARFGEKLQVTIEIDPTTETHLVPAFAVQTLVENAVKHGLEKRREGGCIEIRSHHRKTGVVEVVVTDSGVGISGLLPGDENQGFFGIGLSNVYERLRQLYGRNDLMRIESSPETGTRVTLILPPAAVEAGMRRTVSSPAIPQN
jgi:two-component system, LytTR family, sensor kinase